MAVKIHKGFVSGDIDMAPMIDCVFLLLIFFLVATEFEKTERELATQLPQASEAMPITAKPKELTVNVDKDGRIIVNRQTLTEAQLLAALQQAAANNPGRQKVIIRADRRCVWQHVVTVMDLCNKAHIRDYVVAAANDNNSP